MHRKLTVGFPYQKKNKFNNGALGACNNYAEAQQNLHVKFCIQRQINV